MHFFALYSMEIDMKINLRLLCAVVLSPMAFALAAGCAGCNMTGTEENAPKGIDSIAIMTWNVQELFDGVDDGTEYDEYRESAGWT